MNANWFVSAVLLLVILFSLFWCYSVGVSKIP
jgi:hypothetical protein